MAAGLSSRLFGANKILADVNGAPLIAWVIEESVASELNRITLVLGPNMNLPVLVERRVFSHPRVRTVTNPSPENGMSSSILAGMRCLDSSSDGVALILGDQPLITAAVINTLLASFRKYPERIVAPLIQGRRTTPVIVPAALFPEIMLITGDVGARSIVKRHAEEVIGVEMALLYDDTDVDTQDDLVNIRKKMADRKGDS